MARCPFYNFRPRKLRNSLNCSDVRLSAPYLLAVARKFASSSLKRLQYLGRAGQARLASQFGDPYDAAPPPRHGISCSYALSAFYERQHKDYGHLPYRFFRVKLCLHIGPCFQGDRFAPYVAGMCGASRRRLVPLGSEQRA
jgi:hypothetical protein